MDNGGMGVDDTRFSTFKLPWRHDFEPRAGGGALHLEAVLGVLTAKDHLQFDTPSGLAQVRQKWSLVGTHVGGGWSIPIGRGWTLRPGVGVALGRIDNDASLNAAAQMELPPGADGTVINFDAWAALYSASVTIEHPRTRGTLDAGFAGRYTYAHTDVFSASSTLQEGHDDSRFLGLRGELGGPTAWTTFGDSVDWDTFLGFLGLYDIQRESLGFDSFFELGGGITVRVSHRLPALRMSGAWIFGQDIQGWTFGISFAPFLREPRS